MSKDIFSETGNSNDKPLGNDFLELDDPNQNGDFSTAENDVAADGINQEDGNIDAENINHDSNNDFEFNDEDIQSDEENLDLSEFETYDQVSQVSNEEEEEEEEEENEESNEDPEFLNNINNKYKTNFKSEKEFQDFLKNVNKEETKETIIVSAKEQEQYDKYTGNIKYLDSVLQKDNEAIIRESEIIKHFQTNQSKPNADDLENIDEKIELLRNAGTLDLNADNVRNKFSLQKSKLEAFTNKIDEKIEGDKTAKQQRKQEELKSSFRDIFVTNEGKFMGVKITTQQMQTAYDEVKSGDFVKRIMNNPKLAASLSLMERNMKAIQKVTSQPGYSDGIDTILEGNKKNGKRMGSNTSSSRSSGSKQNMSSDQKFAQ